MPGALFGFLETFAQKGEGWVQNVGDQSVEYGPTLCCRRVAPKDKAGYDAVMAKKRELSKMHESEVKENVADVAVNNTVS